jgi:hypothetical protein
VGRGPGSPFGAGRPGYASRVPRGRLTITVALATALVAGLTLASCGGDDEASTTTAETTTQTTETETTTQTTETETTTQTTEDDQPVVVRVTVLGGAAQGGIVRETARKGDRVVLVVRSDEADEVHVHGYDLYRDVAPGSPARIAFVADVAGRFAVEFHERGTQIADLTVRP